TLVFIIVRVVPGDPATAALGDYASKEAVEALRQRMGLDKPLYIQYVDFLSGLLRGDLGRSLISSQPVIDQIRFALPHTIELALAAILIGLVLGIPVGIITAVRRNTMIDYVGRVLSLAGLSFPAFYLGILLLYFFSVRWRLFPTLGAGLLGPAGQPPPPGAAGHQPRADRDGLHRAHDPLGDDQRPWRRLRANGTSEGA